MHKFVRGFLALLTLVGLVGLIGPSDLADATEPQAAPVAAATTTVGHTSRIDTRCVYSGRALCVDKSRRKLYFVREGTVVKKMDARFGCSGTRTREGSFKIRRKSRHHVSSLYHTPMPYAMFFSGGQAVHYSPDFARRGYAGCSHGCVNIRNNAGIRWVFDRMRVGDRVIVYRS